jgi:hypothetical protein
VLLLQPGAHPQPKRVLLFAFPAPAEQSPYLLNAAVVAGSDHALFVLLPAVEFAGKLLISRWVNQS